MELIRPGIQRPDDELAAAQGFDRLTVSFEMEVFIREALVIEELGPVETDALSTPFEGGGDLFVQLDVCRESDFMTIDGFRRPADLLLQLAVELFGISRLAPVARQGLFVGIDDDLSGIAIDHQGVAIDDLSGDILETYHRRHLERSRQDGRMRCTASNVYREADHHLLGHRRCLAGCQVVGDNGNVLPKNPGLASLAKNSSQELPLNVPDVM